MKNKPNLTFIEKENAILEIDKERKIVMKRFKNVENITTHLNNNEWLRQYKFLYEKTLNEKYQLVEVHDATPQRIIMKYHENQGGFMDIRGDHKLTNNIVCDAMEFLNIIWLEILKSRNCDDNYFVNYDLHPRNVMLGENNKIILIDPDSFDFRPKEKVQYHFHAYQKMYSDFNTFYLNYNK